MAGLFEKAKQFADSEQGEKITDQLLGGASAAASKLTGGKHDDQIRSARDAADAEYTVTGVFVASLFQVASCATTMPPGTS
jgi:hypothetical protein